MKSLKIILLSILSIFVAVYLAFLFILPYAVDLNQYSPQITKAIEDSTGFKVHIDGLKIKTAWNLSAGALIDKTELSYPTGSKFTQINNLQIRLSLFPMILGQLKIDKIDVDKIMLNLDVKKDGKLLIEDYLPKTTATPQKQTLKLSDNMPDISAKAYRISFVDKQNSKTYSIKGSDFKVTNFILNKKIKLKTNGELVLNNRKQVTYNLSFFSKALATTQPQAKTAQSINIIRIFEDLYKYNARADINAIIKMTGTPEEPKIDGDIDLNKIAFTIGGKTLPPSNVCLAFKGDKIKINSNLNTDISSKAVLSGVIKNGKRKFVDLHVVSDKINLDNAVFIANTLMQTFGIKDLEGTSASGYLKADFKIKSDFKRIQSNGYLKIQNANVYNKTCKAGLNAINADIDFSQDAIKIRQAKANFNSQPITIMGMIDKNANADIKILANNLQLKGLLLTTGNASLLKDNDIQGLINLSASIKGRLDKAIPKADVTVSDIIIKNRPSKTQIKLAKVTINVLAGKKLSGEIKLNNMKAYQSASSIASAPTITLSLYDNELKINKSYLYLNGIRTTLEGKISNITSTPRLNNVSISIPNQVSFPLDGLAGSSVLLKGNLTLNGNPENPQISGHFSIPLIRIPSMSLSIKNSELSLGEIFSISCPQIYIANSTMSFSSQISKDFSQGLVLKNANFTSSNLDLDKLGAAMSKAPQSSSSDLGIAIANGKTTVGRFKTGNIIATNITSSMQMKNNILYLDNLDAKAYGGNIKGAITYNVLNGKTGVNVKGRGLSANTALTALSGRNDHIVGVMDFDSNISMRGATEKEIINSLNGTTDFIISNGQMGVLGKFEHLLYAQNILSNNAFKATLNVIAKALTLKNTGVYKYMKGKIYLSNGWANIQYIKTSGPSMSLYIKGRYYLAGSTAHLIILGRISDDVVRVLGPIGEFSMNKAISSIPKIGEITAFIVSQFTVNPNYENTDLIPELSPKTEFGTKEFKVVIDGDIQKQNSVKSFKWISKPIVAQTQSPTRTINPANVRAQYQTTVNQAQTTVQGYQESVKQQYNQVKKQIPTSVPDFVNKLPDLLLY